MIFDQNKEKLPIETSAGEPEEKAKSLSETPVTDSAGQEKRSVVTVSPTPVTAPVRPIEQAKPAANAGSVFSKTF